MKRLNLFGERFFYLFLFIFAVFPEAFFEIPPYYVIYERTVMAATIQLPYQCFTPLEILQYLYSYTILNI